MSFIFHDEKLFMSESLMIALSPGIFFISTLTRIGTELKHLITSKRSSDALILD